MNISHYYSCCRIGEFIDISSGFDGCISQLLINGDNTPLSYPSPMPVIQGLDVHSCTDNNPCDPQPCLNGGTCVAVENGGEFNCLCPKYFKGFRFWLDKISSFLEENMHYYMIVFDDGGKFQNRSADWVCMKILNLKNTKKQN